MKKFMVIMWLCLTSCANEMIQTAPTATLEEDVAPRLLYRYESSISCRGCHSEQYQQYEDSMHARAFTNPLFNTKYFNEIVPRALKDRNFVAEARKCVSCHAPVVFMNYSGLVSTPAQATRYETGVTCDFCHTLGGYTENGDFQQVPSGKKQGPFAAVKQATHHAEYSGFVQLGEFCGRCHSGANHTGIEAGSTFDEWRESSYGGRRFACQECHMSKDGYLKKGIAEFEQGQAAHMNIGSTAKKQKEYSKLYSHNFPGAHSPSQLEEALQLDIKVGTRSADTSGRLPFTLVVNNERSGHKMPSGSSDLRFMWLVVTATAADGTAIPAELHRPDSTDIDYSVAGSAPDDAAILENYVPRGARLYRTVLVNQDGRQELFQFDAARVAFNNRLAAGELRKEGYYLKLPSRFSGKVTIEAKLYYKGAPESFTRKLAVPPFEKVLVATQKKQITVEAPSAKK